MSYARSLADLSCQGVALRVHVLYVADPDPDFVGFAVDTPEHSATIARRMHESHQQVEAIAEDLRSHGLMAATQVIEGSVAETILESAVHLNADTIVVGSNGHNRLRSLFMGSVTDALLRRSTVPVLVVPGGSREP